MKPVALARQVCLFCGVGAINTVISLLVILTLSEIAGIHYVFANIAGYAVGLAISFFLHRNITFLPTAKSRPLTHQAKGFLIVFAIAYTAQLLCLIFLVNLLGWNKVFSQILACCLYTIVNFIGNRQHTFRPSSRP